MVSVTVLVVSVLLVIEPWVKLGTTGTDIAVWTFARADTTTTIASLFFVVMHLKILLCRQVIKEVIYHQLIVSSFTNCPVALVPAPPAVIVITPALVIVPARVSFVPAAVDT